MRDAGRARPPASLQVVWREAFPSSGVLSRARLCELGMVMLLEQLEDQRGGP